MNYFLFLFSKVPKNSRIVLYGAGNVGIMLEIVALGGD
ncbi:hypothetical protein R83H12_00091 [Fibrobacteria bacterium R8-3-H12]